LYFEKSPAMVMMNVYKGSYSLKMLVKTVQITLILQCMVDAKGNYFPVWRRDTDLRQQAPGWQQHREAFVRLGFIPCLNCVDSTDSDSAKLITSLSTKNSEAQNFAESGPKHQVCRHKCRHALRAPKLSRSTESICIDFSESASFLNFPVRSTEGWHDPHH
jgi:hypothetical protein